MSQNKSSDYMVKTLVLALFALVLVGLNFAVYDKNNIKQNGEVVYLQLRPVDPRSLMQGDYMALAYDLELKPKIDLNSPNMVQKKYMKQYMVIDIDQNKVAQFSELINNKTDIKLKPNQKIIKINFRYNQAKIRPDAFFFQEGHGELYTKAKYGIFRFKGEDVYILDGLADENRKRLGN